jgi:hypothetical protein
MMKTARLLTGDTLSIRNVTHARQRTNDRHTRRNATLRPITLTPLSFKPSSFKAALALGLGLAALGGGSAAFAQDAPPTPAAPPGPATQPAPPPGTTQPAPTQPQAAPAPPGSATAPGAPAAPPPPPNYKLQYNGLVDGYYLFNTRNPKDVSYGAGEPYYDIRHNSPALSLAELNVFQNAAPGKFGYKATFMTGDTADINHANSFGSSTGEGRFKNVQQLYGTYAFGADGSGVDVGKFYTPFGYEVTESNGNYNYSRSTAYNYVPFYHAGARIYTPVPGLAALTATLYLVNGVFNTATMGVQNDSKRPGYIGQLNYTDPKGKFTLISELGLDKQKFYGAAGPGTKVVVNDNNFTYNFTANTLAGLDYVYRKTTPDGGGKETVNAYAVYFRQALTPKTAVALRFSGASDKFDGGIGANLGAYNDGTTRPYDITATYEIKPTSNFLTRLEYRHDHTNFGSGTPVDAGFFGGNSLPTRSDQDTISLSGVFTFAQ